MGRHLEVKFAIMFRFHSIHFGVEWTGLNKHRQHTQHFCWTKDMRCIVFMLRSTELYQFPLDDLGV